MNSKNITTRIESRTVIVLSYLYSFFLLGLFALPSFQGLTNIPQNHPLLGVKTASAQATIFNIIDKEAAYDIFVEGNDIEEEESGQEDDYKASHPWLFWVSPAPSVIAVKNSIHVEQHSVEPVMVDATVTQTSKVPLFILYKAMKSFLC